MAAEHTLTVTEDDDQQTKSATSRTGQLQRAQWLRAAILGANDGLLSTASLMLGVGSAKEDRWSMVVSGVAGAVAGAFSMAVGEFVSVATQRDIEVVAKLEQAEKVKVKESSLPPPPSPSPGRSPMMRAMAMMGKKNDDDQNKDEEVLPCPIKAAAASGSSFLVGSVVPLLSSAFVSQYKARILVLVAATAVMLAGFGGLGAYLGGSGRVRVSAVRVLLGGCLAMVITYWLLKLLDVDD